MFEDFWKLYPRKVAKKHAESMWKKLTRSQQEKALATIGVHVKYWAKAARTEDKIPHAGSWLNGHRFDDELLPQPTVHYASHDNYIPPPPGIPMPDFVRRLAMTGEKK